jgi:hypothetical protein
MYAHLTLMDFKYTPQNPRLVKVQSKYSYKYTSVVFDVNLKINICQKCPKTKMSETIKSKTGFGHFEILEILKCFIHFSFIHFGFGLYGFGLCGFRTFWFSDILVFGHCGFRTLWFSDIVVFGLCGFRTFWFSDILVFGHFGFWTFWFSDILP